MFDDNFKAKDRVQQDDNLLDRCYPVDVLKVIQ